MNRISTSAFFLLLSLQGLFAQTSYYKFEKLNEIYEPLPNKTVIAAEPDDPLYAVTLDGFSAFGYKLDDRFQVGIGGYILNTNQDASVKRSFAFDAFVGPLMSHSIRSSEMSRSVFVSGNDTVLGFEWKDMAIKGHPAKDFFNFQIFFYRVAQTIEFRYGPSLNSRDSVGEEIGPWVSINLLKADFSEAYDFQQLMGDPANPQADFDPATQQHIQGIPENGTVYRFKKKATTGLKEAIKSAVSIYPNPATDKINIRNKELSGTDAIPYTISDMQGRQLKAGVADAGEITLHEWPEGLYMLTILQHGTFHTFKISKINK